MGATDKFPRWAMAYKFEAEEVTTLLKEVIWQVGRTGKLTPLALLDPVDLGGDDLVGDIGFDDTGFDDVGLDTGFDEGIADAGFDDTSDSFVDSEPIEVGGFDEGGSDIIE